MLSILLLPLLALTATSSLAAPSPLQHPDTTVQNQLVKVRRRISTSDKPFKMQNKRSPKNSSHKGKKIRACAGPDRASDNPVLSATPPTPESPPQTPASPFSAIFPISPRNSWSTADGQANHLDIVSALKPLSAGRLPELTTAPDNSPALVASYPAGTVKYSASTGHGFSFYTAGAHNHVDTTSATEVIFSYAVYFSDGFDFVRGGKLPGLYGGASMDQAKSCSGGESGKRDNCFSARLMWRANGAGEFYNYLPTSGKQENGYCETAPMSLCDPNFGDSIGRGSFYFQSGRWTTVTQRLRLNYPASASNGQQELWVDGRQVLNLSGLQIRMTEETKIYGIMAQTFFGGSDASWASTKDQWAWFKDWSLGVVY